MLLLFSEVGLYLNDRWGYVTSLSLAPSRLLSDSEPLGFRNLVFILTRDAGPKTTHISPRLLGRARALHRRSSFYTVLTLNKSLTEHLLCLRAHNKISLLVT